MDAPVLVELISNPISLNTRVFVPNDENSNPNVNTCDFKQNHDENTGFPFDDSEFEERDRNRSFRSHLDDIAKRHPEFAEHFTFDRFPFRSNTLGHKRRGSEDESKPNRFAEFTDHFNRPSSSRIKEKFGFPFSDTFDAGPEYFHQSDSEPEQRTSKEKQPEENTKPPQVPTNERGRKQNPNIPQSSTVDLGQKQDPVCDTRGQRSMSAPPENRAGQRFVSSINIPINSDGGNDSTPTQQPQQRQQQQQQQPQTKPNERVIPIHVEGRDEPVIPKHTNQTFSQPPPQTEKPFGHNKPGFGAWKRDEPQYYTGEPKFFQSEPTSYFSSDPHFDGRSQFFAQERPNAEHFSNTGAFKQQPNQKPKQSTPPPTQQKSATPPPAQPQQEEREQQVPPPSSASISGPIDQIQCIQKSVLDLMDQVEKFNGRPKDKQYAYLDEMLTRNLLKLDDIDTHGKETIRHARKEAIICIQKCISILEAKAMANERLRNEAMEVDTTSETAAVPEVTPLVALEVSGVARSGSENVMDKEDSETSASMEAVPDVAEFGATQPRNDETDPESTNVQPVSTVDEVNVEKGIESAASNEQSVQENSSQVESDVTREDTKDKKKVKKKVVQK